MRRSAFWVGFAGLCTACTTVNYVGIETYNPAEITFPEDVAKILIVNNAVPQPADAGYTFALFGKEQDTCRVKADSALFDACESLGKAIADADYFNDVLLYNGATRTDDQPLEDRKLSKAEVTALCEANGADAIVSIDRLLFDMKKDVWMMGEGYVVGVIDVKTSGVIRSYLPGREVPLATVYVADSISWAESADNLPMLDVFLPDAENALRTTGEYIGAKAYANFVPHWVNESRWYFTGMGATWKEASAFAAAEKWDQAAERWQSLYDSSGGWKGKARAASNLALCREMEGKMPEAYEWASKSYQLFLKNSGEENRYTQLLKLYADALAERIRNDKKLNIQFGVE